MPASRQAHFLDADDALEAFDELSAAFEKGVDGARRHRYATGRYELGADVRAALPAAVTPRARKRRARDWASPCRPFMCM